MLIKFSNNMMNEKDIDMPSCITWMDGLFDNNSFCADEKE